MILKKGLRLALSLLAAAALLWFAFRDIDLAEVVAHMSHADPRYLALAVLCQGVHLALRSYRWRILLSPLKPGIGFYSLFSATAIGYFLSLVFFRVGEVLRPMMLAQRERISASGAIATCVLERLMDFLSVALLFGFYLVFLFAPPEGGTGALDMERVRRYGLIFGAALLAVFPILYLVVHNRRAIHGWMDRHPRLGRTFIPRALQSFLGGFDAVKSGRAFAVAWAQSIAIWLSITASIWVSLEAFGLGVGFNDSLMMMGLLTVGIAVPTPGGVGSYEYAGQLGLVSLFGVESNRAAASILVTHFFAIAPVMVAGAVLLWRQGLSLKGLLNMGSQPRPGSEASS